MAKIVCFGEVLWDVFPTHKKIGGAPLNVAIRLQSFNNYVSMISAIGKDELGKQILDFIQQKDINSSFIQILDNYETGEVAVTLDKKGSATYQIVHPKAWDKIKFTQEAAQIVQQADAFVFGSLITRDEVSRKSLYQFLKYANYAIFDVNLRSPYYTKEILLELMVKADFIKFNDDELYEISGFLGSKFNNLEQNIHFIAEKTNTKHICVTKGRHGAVLFYDDNLYYNSGYQIKVKDTVGAGDSFLGTLISNLLNSNSPQNALNIACAIGALVAQKEGANPVISDKEITDFINPE